MAALALSAAIASSASAAAPEFQKGGKPLSETVTFSASTKTGWTIKAAHGTEECTVEVTGETKGAKEVAKVVIKFTKCSGTACESFAKWESKELHGHLGLISPTSVGLLLEGSTEVFAANKLEPCFDGSLIGEIKPVGRSTTEYSLENDIFEKYPEFREEISSFEGESFVHRLIEFAHTEFSTEVGIGLALPLKMSKAIEVKA